MKTVLESLKNGKIEVVEVPPPSVRPGTVLVRNSFSAISTGTERMLVNFGRASAMGKAMQQPEKVKQVIEKARTDGIATTLTAVRNKLDQPMTLGYSCAGTVIEVGEGVRGLKPGDRVAGNGSHAQIVRIPQNLCARVPDGVELEEASFAAIAAIAMQGIRLLNPTLGETVVVTGLGLLGLISVQLLQANGCRVLGIDLHREKLDIARGFGADVVDVAAGEDPVAAAREFSRSRGVDGVLLCAAGESSDMVNQAAEMCRVRGRVIQVGLSGLNLTRENFFRKEIRFQVSNSTGPGRGDPSYEDKGNDYPVGFVRWTQQRNFEAVLDLLAESRLQVKPLISSRYSIDDAQSAYDAIAGRSSAMAIVLEYPELPEAAEANLRARTVRLPAIEQSSAARPDAHAPAVAFIGSGNYATSVLIPAFKAGGADLRTVVSSAGVSGVHAARKFGFAMTTTDTASVFRDPAIDTVAITTRHDSHAALVCDALGQGKRVFVEKPMALTLAEVDAIETAYADAAAAGRQPVVMVGFNRRFAPHVAKVKSLLASVREPSVFLMTVNAGPLPPNHWLHDPRVGGGRILGEACHFIDLLRFLAGSPITGFDASPLGRQPGAAASDDRAAITLQFEDGSTGLILYVATGHKSFPKERLEVFSSGRVLQLDNYRRLTGFGWPGFGTMRLWRQDKGQAACAAAFLRSVAGPNPTAPIPFGELLEVSRVTVQIAESLR